MTDLSKRVAVVTGGSRGIGKAVAISLAEARAGVAVNYLEQSAAAESVVKAIRDKGGKAIAVRADVSQAAEVARMMAEVGKALGPVDVLVNNAGIGLVRTVDTLTEADFDTTIAVNLKSVFLCTQAVIPGMRARKWGRIVQISSINGQKGQYGQANYAAAKAGMHGFTISLAQENAKFGITVNTVSPGYVATDMVMAVPAEVRAKIEAQIPLGRLGRPEEIAHAVAFLTGEETGWMTGANLAINGGQYMGW